MAADRDAEVTVRLLTRDDLRVPVFKSIGWAHRTVTDDELKEMGYVTFESAKKASRVMLRTIGDLHREIAYLRKRLCGECEDGWIEDVSPYGAHKCPNCNTNGYGEVD